MHIAFYYRRLKVIRRENISVESFKKEDLFTRNNYDNTIISLTKKKMRIIVISMCKLLFKPKQKAMVYQTSTVFGWNLGFYDNKTWLYMSCISPSLPVLQTSPSQPV